MYDIIIVGAGTAGLTAAIYARRAGKSVVIYESETYGGQIINTPEIENYPGIKNVSGYKFATDLYEQAVALGAELVFDKIVKIEGSFEEGFTLTTEFKKTCEGKTIILACGAKNRHLGLPMEERLLGRGISYCATCDGAFFKGKDVAVNGGGNTALEDAIYLAGLCNKVYLVHRRDEFRGEKALSDIVRSTPNIELVLNSTVTELKGEKKLEAITVKDTVTSGERDINVEALFVAIGQVPSNEPFAELVALDNSGYVIAGEDCKTNVKGIFAAGDGRTKTLRQLTTAAADGAVSAVACCDLILHSQN
ncbi:MAG: thioredoxin-disulfide reductase [Clostridiales bacterium]|nr:thioredoxin-disulfide reductase [Clostridiales bacterium]